MPTGKTPALLFKCGERLNAGAGIGLFAGTWPPLYLRWPMTMPRFSGSCTIVGARSVIEIIRPSVVPFCRSVHCIASNSSPSPSSDVKPEENRESTATPIQDLANLLEIKVGKIIKAWKHEEADSLYVEEVDVGESEPRIICSGLANYMPLCELEDTKVVVLANLKPRNMRGVKSNGMLMAASDSSHEKVELLRPPADSVPGERIWFGSPDDRLNQPPPATPNQLQKKKIWETVQPFLKTDGTCNCILGDHLMRTTAGVIVSKSLSNANIS